MEAALSSAVAMFRAADHYMSHSTSGLPAEMLTRRIGAANSILWIAGHATVGRLRLLALLGDPDHIPWEAFFGKGSAEAMDPARPDLDAVLARWRGTAKPLEQRLAALTATELSAALPYDLPTADPTLLGVVTYFAFHEAYHVGQIASMRKALGRGLPRRTADRASLRTSDHPH
jgi:hypothetical protein